MANVLSQFPPRHCSRGDRVRALSAVADALRVNKKPHPADALLVGNAITWWLQFGESFDGWMRVRAPKGSHRTPQAIYKDQREKKTGHRL